MPLPELHILRSTPPMAPLFLLLLSSSFPFLISAFPPSYPQVSMLIDCGGSANFTTTNLGGGHNRTWLSDRYFSCGIPSPVSEPHVFSQHQERTLRSFPPTSCGRRSCYSLPVPYKYPNPPRYYLRLFSVYDNYDSKLQPPPFSVSFLATLGFSFPSPWPSQASHLGFYYDLFLPSPPPSSHSSQIDVCFHPLSTDPPVISSIELVAVDPRSYDSSTTGDHLLLVNYARLTCGSSHFGPGFTNDSDAFHRNWHSDAPLRSIPSPRALSTSQHVFGADRPPNHFPEHLYRTAITSTEHSASITYSLPVDPSGIDYLMWFHFAELDDAVVRVGQRVFDVYIDGKNVQRIDIFEKVGKFAAFTWQHVVRNLTGPGILNVTLAPIVGPPVISGIENYAMIPLDPVTVPSQAEAMEALRESLRVPERMGWSGDPCAPMSVDTWEGVTCQQRKEGLVITQLDLGSQDLKGHITDRISTLSDLTSLNLSSNSLEGSLPSDLGGRSLQKLDLSGNQFSGGIPASLGSSKLQVVLLNDNQLEGQVPEKLYSIGVHGGEIDLSGNKGLCGVPSLPPCSLIWEKGKLSTKAKLAVGLSCVVLLCLISLAVYIFRFRRRQHHYEFAFSQDLTSVAAKRNRYQRQKSLMLMEMETQNSNGFHSTGHPL